MGWVRKRKKMAVTKYFPEAIRRPAMEKQLCERGATRQLIHEIWEKLAARSDKCIVKGITNSYEPPVAPTIQE